MPDAADRVADAVLALLSDDERSAELPLQRVGALQALYVEARKTRADLPARSCALYTFVTRGRDALDPQCRRPPSLRPGQRSVMPPPSLVTAPERTFPAWVPESAVLGGFRLVRPMASGPSMPNAGSSRRNERGPIPQRAASLAIAPTPCSVAAVAQPLSSSRRQG